MEGQPLVSVIMPCYNMERYIADTILSVQGQTYTHWELLIVDDASTDGTAEVVKRFCDQDPRIRFFVKPSHSGIADSRNQCLQQATGRYLAFLDADDLWHPDKLEQQLAFVQERQAALCYSAYDLVDENGKSLGKTIHTAGDLDYTTYLKNTIIGCSTVMVDKELTGLVTVPEFRTSEDTATWLDLMKKGFKACALEQALTSYRIRAHSASSNKLKAASDLWKVYRQHEKLPFFKAVAYFSSYAFHALKKHLF